MPISQVPFAGISNPVDFRNIVINGDMQIAQRSTSVASITANGYYTVDRMALGITSLGTWTQSQSTDVPTGQGFANSLKMDCTTADASPSAGDLLVFEQGFEGQNLQYLKKGTADALPLTASFWVKSTKTGTFICELVDTDNNRSISKSYTVNVTNTWEKKTITYEGDTTGALDNDNAKSLVLVFWLGAGSTYSSGTLQTTWGSTTNANRAVGQVNIADSTSNDWYITGVQLEAGEQASGFEFMPIDVNLARCLRYYYGWGNSDSASGAAQSTGSNTSIFKFDMPTTMRATPTVTKLGTVNIDDYFANSGTAGTISTINGAGINNISIFFNAGTGNFVAPRPLNAPGTNNTGSNLITFSAEL